jgi:pyruvate ferredoxin oxidoreductase gamma subunit|uniref:Pyruvate synthase n=1 Tax=candidate division WOR-3 bacterium TaxID=2052148 RepID=A0A7C3Z353_UNCW3
MKEKVLEIRWHGRGGQGARLAALFLGEVVSETGKYIQAFPEFGPERMGAPVVSYNRISEERIRNHAGIKNPDIIVILDPTLFFACEVLSGLKEDGIILVNTTESPEEIKKRLGLTKAKVWTVDASGIALSLLKRDIPNTPMLGALFKVMESTGRLALDLSSVRAVLERKLSQKFRGKAEIVSGNLSAIEKAYLEVRGG